MAENYLEQIYKQVSHKALEKLKTEKATKISRKTLVLIALAERLYKVLYMPI